MSDRRPLLSDVPLVAVAACTAACYVAYVAFTHGDGAVLSMVVLALGGLAGYRIGKGRS